MKIKLLLPLLLLFTLSMFSQGHEDKKDQIKALKVSYLTTELSLTTAESEKFWPVYNAYEDKVYQIRHDKMRPIYKKLGDGALDKMTDKEAQPHLDKLQAADKELFQLREKLLADLRPIIGAKKILKLKWAEEDFKRKLLDKFKDKKKD
ncbi:hypothetical protein [Flavobacterium subsaxonicum]|uniref:Sensor of ECF-type sigma factor n=1 Tax=Flavobacterium subsaxonicum WB 4.1-42 = DSM 21790 TaxID=1121898 RepID=A0A0A2N350_9FLAO|nr:hypothetical protein [Flavobacterium subsaxonicum]KGO94885.1 sensor of ECF-type sigma factor [Flavobacterium subsaxonicum WB 4.1-42 = DSM 21790]